ncbi:MAG: hypothetical protein QOJ64_1481 [Acidobacteriota bacterium]|nr:hypothetical protein [Acidobacteriota bacterium]
MNSCPTCQQVYPDGLEICPNDGSRLTNPTQAYNPGQADYRFQTPSDQGRQMPPAWQAPAPTWGPYQPGQYPPAQYGQGQYPPGQYPPYGYANPYAPTAGGEGIASAALWTGISTIGTLLLGFLLIAVAASSFPPNTGLAGTGGILIFLSFIVGLTALILGIVAASMSSRNPAISKPKAIVGLCLGTVPLLLLIIVLIAGSPFRRF